MKNFEINNQAKNVTTETKQQKLLEVYGPWYNRYLHTHYTISSTKYPRVKMTMSIHLQRDDFDRKIFIYVNKITVNENGDSCGQCKPMFQIL